MKTQDLSADELKNINGGADDGTPPPVGTEGDDSGGTPNPMGDDGVGSGNEYGPNGPSKWHRIP